MPQVDLSSDNSIKLRLFELTSDPMAVADLHGRLLAVNPAFARLLGLSESQMAGVPVTELIHPADLLLADAALKKAWSGDRQLRFTARFRRADGDYLWLQWVVTAEGGSMYATGRDVSAQRRLEEDLKQRAEQMQDMLINLNSMQTDLRRRTQEFRALVEYNPDWVVRYGAEGHHLYVNAGMAQVVGQPQEQILGRTIREVMGDLPLTDELEAAIEHIFRTGEDALIELSFPSGEQNRSYSAHLMAEKDEQGNTGSVLAICHDITAQRELEHQLRESESWYRGIVESQIDLVSRQLPDTTLLFVNDAYCKFYGKTREELIGKSFLVTEAPEVHEMILEKVRRAASEPGPRIEENLTYSPDGTERWVQWVSYSFADETGKVTMIQSVGRDITDQKRAEHVLRENEERFRAMVEAVSEGILLIDALNNITLVNRYIEQRFGYSRAQLLDQKYELLLADSSRAAVWNALDRARQTQQIVSIKAPEVAFAQPIVGPALPVEITFVPITLAGQHMVMCLMVDVIERQQLEEQRLINRALEVELEKERELIELKQRFAAMVTHEFRTPLAVIESTIDIVQNYLDRLPKDKLIERLDIVSKQSRRMHELLNDILTYSRGERGLEPGTLEEVDLGDFCLAIINDLQMADNEAHAITLEVQNPPVRLPTDRRLLEHICLNLIGNAIKYSAPHSPIMVRVAREHDSVTLTVIDQGIGIPDADLSRIYNPFHRAANVGSRSGSGLGLPIVKQCVEALGGTITAMSRVSQGSTFTVALPAAATSD